MSAFSHLLKLKLRDLFLVTVLKATFFPAFATALASTAHLQGTVLNNGIPAPDVQINCTLQVAPAAVSVNTLVLPAKNYYFFAPAPNGAIYAAAGPTGNFISTISPDGSINTFTTTNINFTLGIAVDASGDVYVANSNVGTILKFNSSGGYLGTVASDPRLDFIYGLKIDAKGNLYAAINASAKNGTALGGSIQKIAPDGTISTFANIENPIGMAFDANGNLFVANNVGNNGNVSIIQKITPDGTISTFATGFQEPWGLAFDAAGNLLVSDALNQALYSVSPAGVVTTLCTIPSSTHVRDVAITANGTLFLGESTPKSVVYTVTNNSSGTYGTMTTFSTTTDGNGNFDLGVVGGNWCLTLDSSSAATNNLVGSTLSGTIVDGQIISGLLLPVLPGTGVINGTVTDFSGNPLALDWVGAGTTLNGVPYTAGAYTDATGNYSFPVFNGPWNINVGGQINTGFYYNQATANVTNSATVNFVPSTIIAQQPISEAILAGQNTSYSVQTTVPVGEATFQWQNSTNGGASWSNLSDNSLYSGTATSTLVANNAAITLLGGEFRVVITSAGGTMNSQPATLNVYSPDSWNGWLLANFSPDQLSNATIVTAGAVPAGDGISNLVKYAFNLSPMINGQAVLPQPLISNGELTLTYPMLRDDVSYTVQTSADLVNWSTAGIALLPSRNEVTASYELPGSGLVFIRVVVSYQP